jgi:hypothetical protein
MTTTRLVLLATWLFFAVSACGQANGGGAKPAAAPAAAQQATDPGGSPAHADAGAVTASCGGGVTGGGGGVTLRSDHHVISWQKATASAARTETDLGADDMFFADIHRHLQTAGFSNISYDQPADMTCSLTAGGHTVSWQPGDPNAPASVLAIHRLLMSVSG